jgi:hypothetical protein
VIAHVGGVPLEEMLPTLAGTSSGLLVARVWLMLHLLPKSTSASPEGEAKWQRSS